MLMEYIDVYMEYLYVDIYAHIIISYTEKVRPSFAATLNNRKRRPCQVRGGLSLHAERSVVRYE